MNYHRRHTIQLMLAAAFAIGPVACTAHEAAGAWGEEVLAPSDSPAAGEPAAERRNTALGHHSPSLPGPAVSLDTSTQVSNELLPSTSPTFLIDSQGDFTPSCRSIPMGTPCTIQPSSPFKGMIIVMYRPTHMIVLQYYMDGTQPLIWFPAQPGPYKLFSFGEDINGRDTGGTGTLNVVTGNGDVCGG